MEMANQMALGAFDEIGYSEWVYLYFAAVIFIKACCAGAFAEFALWLSTKITNVFVTLAAPMLAYYVLNTLMMCLILFLSSGIKPVRYFLKSFSERRSARSEEILLRSCDSVSHWMARSVPA